MKEARKPENVAVLRVMKYYVIIRENIIKLHVLLWENLLTEKTKYIVKYANDIIRACIYIIYMYVCIYTHMHIYFYTYNYREIVKDIFENAHF